MRDPRSPFSLQVLSINNQVLPKMRNKKIFNTNAIKEENPQTAPLIPISGKFFTTNATKENHTKTRAPFFQYCQS